MLHQNSYACSRLTYLPHYEAPMSEFEIPEHDRIPADELEVRAPHIEEAARDLLMAVWRQIQLGEISERGPVPDAALILRDVLNPKWPADPDWLPEPLATEREQGYPNLK